MRMKQPTSNLFIVWSLWMDTNTSQNSSARIQSQGKKFLTSNLKIQSYRCRVCWWRRSLKSTRNKARWKCQFIGFKKLILSIQDRQFEKFEGVNLNLQRMWLKFLLITMKYQFWMGLCIWLCWHSSRITYKL